MDYKLERMEIDDRNRIENDFVNDCTMANSIKSYFRHPVSQNHCWAIDHDCKSYLMMIPSMIGSFTPIEVNYVFHWSSKNFKLKLLNKFSNDLEICDQKNGDESIAELRLAISHAFEVHGRWGVANNTLKLVPKFVE